MTAIMEDDKANADLMVAVTSEKLSEISADILEAFMDSNLADGIVKDVPFLGIGLKLFQVSKRVSDYFFLKKVLSFLKEVKDIPLSERVQFAKDLESKGFKEAGEKMMFLISRLDDLGKASIIGKLLAACIKKKFTYVEFQRLSYCVDQIFFGDLVELQKRRIDHSRRHPQHKHHVSISELKEMTLISLNKVGLLSYKQKVDRKGTNINNYHNDQITVPPMEFEYKKTALFNLLVEFGL